MDKKSSCETGNGTSKWSNTILHHLS